MIYTEPRRKNIEEPCVHVVTQGGAKTILDVERILEGKVKKVSPMPPKFQVVLHKEFLQDVVESPRNVSDSQKDVNIFKEHEIHPED